MKTTLGGSGSMPSWNTPVEGQGFAVRPCSSQASGSAPPCYQQESHSTKDTNRALLNVLSTRPAACRSAGQPVQSGCSYVQCGGRAACRGNACVKMVTMRGEAPRRLNSWVASTVNISRYQSVLLSATPAGPSPSEGLESTGAWLALLPSAVPAGSSTHLAMASNCFANPASG